MKNGSLLFSRLLCCNEAARETGESTNGALARLLAGIKSGRSCQRNGKLFFDRPMFGLNMRATCRVLATPSDRLLFHLIVRYVRYVQLSENGRTTNGRKWRMMIVSLFFIFLLLNERFPRRWAINAAYCRDRLIHFKLIHFHLNSVRPRWWLL